MFNYHCEIVTAERVLLLLIINLFGIAYQTQITDFTEGRSLPRDNECFVGEAVWLQNGKLVPISDGLVRLFMHHKDALKGGFMGVQAIKQKKMAVWLAFSGAPDWSRDTVTYAPRNNKKIIKRDEHYNKNRSIGRH